MALWLLFLCLHRQLERPILEQSARTCSRQPAWQVSSNSVFTERLLTTTWKNRRDENPLWKTWDGYLRSSLWHFMEIIFLLINAPGVNTQCMLQLVSTIFIYLLFCIVSMKSNRFQQALKHGMQYKKHARCSLPNFEEWNTSQYYLVCTVHTRGSVFNICCTLSTLFCNAKVSYFL